MKNNINLLKTKFFNKNFKGWYILVLILFGVLVSVYFVFIFVTKNTETKIKQELLNFTNIVSASVDPLEIEKLTGMVADYNNPEYQKLIKRFVQMGDINKSVRYIYIIGKNVDTSLFFYLDSQPTRFNELKGVEPTAQPGEKYVDETGDFLLTLNENKEVISDPYTDKWGTFISVSVPIIDSNSKTIALLGVDMDLSDFNNRVQLSQIMVLVISLFLIILIILFFIYLRSQYFYKNKINLEKQKIQKYLDATPSLVLGLSPSFKVMMINQFGCSFLDAKKEDIVGKNWFENFVPEDTRNKLRSFLENVFNSEIGFENFEPIENDIFTLKGERKSILWNYNVVYDDNQIIEILVLGQDITSKKIIEQELTKNNLELERLNKLMVGRELEMIKLKKELAGLKNK